MGQRFYREHKTETIKKISDVKLPMPAGLKKVDEPVAVIAEETAENA